MVRFSVNPSPALERFAAQLALARVHPCLVPLERSPGGYSIVREQTRGWFELRAQRGLAGYGLARALRMLLDALAGLSALEDTRTEKGQPFVHGELVPAMLRVDETGTARLTPLAPWHWSAPGTLPAAERCGHLAPERLLGDAIDLRADVFSAGVLLWEALAGRRLFERDSVDGIVTRLLGGKVTLPELPPELSWAAPLKAVAMCALSVDPEQRFASVAELAEAIEAVAAGRVATHAEVASYFRSPDPGARPSVIARPPSLPTHHSSLSALVAPLQPSELAPSPSQSASRDSQQAAAPRVRRSVLAIAALSCVLSAVGASAVARLSASRGDERRAASSAPLAGAPLTSLTLAVPSARLAPTSAAPAASETPPPNAELVRPSAEIPDQPSKAPKSGGVSKAPAVKAHPTAKPGRAYDKAASKYGI